MIISLLLLGVLLGLTQADDKMTQLNTCPALTSDMYSGFLVGTGTNGLATGKQYHYLMVQSESDPVNDPVVFWFTGGPGCSSLLAFAQENGPYFIDNIAKTCTTNPYTWSKNLTMVYLEHPVAVGYSVSPENLTWNDISQS
jgi:carboxypeptidase C (cathepsin A)